MIVLTKLFTLIWDFNLTLISINKNFKMFKAEFLNNITQELIDLKNQGLYKGEHEIISSQSANIEIHHQHNKKKVLNFSWLDRLD